jgi:hypothetical protein
VFQGGCVVGEYHGDGVEVEDLENLAAGAGQMREVDDAAVLEDLLDDADED